MHPEEEYAVRALRAGAAGYLTKKSAPTELVAAIQKVTRGERYVSASLGEVLARTLQPTVPAAAHEALSDREFQVFEMLVSGTRPNEIAKHLGVSVKTISTHRARLPDHVDPSQFYLADSFDQAGRLTDALPLYRARAEQTRTIADRLR